METTNHASEQSLDAVVSDGLQFLQSLTVHYGHEVALEVWDAMAVGAAADIRQRVLIAMLQSDSGATMRVQRGTCTQTVAAIKVLRTYSGVGLKEAKDMWDASAAHSISITIDRAQRHACRADLRALGMVVS